MFSTDLNDIRVAMGATAQILPGNTITHSQELKNALFYPSTLLQKIAQGDTTSEIRPYTASFGAINSSYIPNAGGGTDPCTGFAYAFNLLSPSANLPAEYGTSANKGRRGAAKLVIFETDGVPNQYRTAVPTPATGGGYNTYYQTLGGATAFDPTGEDGQGNQFTTSTTSATDKSNSLAVIDQMRLTMSTSASSGNSGLSLPNAPCLVYPIAFGDLFDPTVVNSGTLGSGYTYAYKEQVAALQFVALVAQHGGTGASGQTTIPSTQIIYGTYATRISTMKTCLQNIFQSGVAVTLVQ